MQGFQRNVFPVDPVSAQRRTEELTLQPDGVTWTRTRTVIEQQQPDGSFAVLSDVPR